MCLSTYRVPYLPSSLSVENLKASGIGYFDVGGVGSGDREVASVGCVGYNTSGSGGDGSGLTGLGNGTGAFVLDYKGHASSGR